MWMQFLFRTNQLQTTRESNRWAFSVIDAIAGPGMADDIRLSTLEPVQQLGARLAQVLSAELSRLRSDVAFAGRMNISGHDANHQADTVRASQIASTAQCYLGLNVQTELRARRATGDRADVAEHGSDFSQGGDRAQEDDLAISQIVRILPMALRRIKEQLTDVGLSGEPVICLLPATFFIDHHGSASIRHQQGQGQTATLILCLAFDGDLGEMRKVWGYIYQSDRLLGSMEGHWFDESGYASDVDHLDVYKITREQRIKRVADAPVDRDQAMDELDVFALSCDTDRPAAPTSLQGFQIGLRPAATACPAWHWSARQWSWA